MYKTFEIADSWGVASLRQCTGFTDGVNYIAPLGCSLIKWDLEKRVSTLQQVHDDLIVVTLVSSTGNILTVGYGGQVKLWDKTFNVYAQFFLPTSNIIYGSWSPNGCEFGVTSKGANQQAVVYKLENVLHQYQSMAEIIPKWSCKAPQMEREDGTEKRKTYDCFNAIIFKENSQIILIYQSIKVCRLFLLSSTGKILKTCTVSPFGDSSNDMICVTEKIQQNSIAIGLHRGLFGFYDVDSLDLLRVIQAMGAPRVCLWIGDVFVAMAYTSGMMTLWNDKGHLLQEIEGGPKGSIVQMNRDPNNDSIIYLGGIMSLHKVKIHSGVPAMKRIVDLSYLTLTGCGVALNNNKTIACGDFTGNVILWKTKDRSPIASINIEASVRSLLWLTEGTLLIGTLSCQLICWRNAGTDGDDEIESLYHFIGDVTKLGCNSSYSKLAVSTTAGYLYMFSVLSGDKFDLVEDYSKQVHEPKQNENGFLNMEIWSLAWSPDDLHLATTSEDQSTIISFVTSGETKHVLNGHTTAVTDVSWKILLSGKNVLATCADDQTIRLYDGDTFDLIRIVNTHDIYGWHTLTYLCINTNKNLMFVSTQHGYLIAWDLDTFERVCCSKMHAGSIEGIALTPCQEFLVTLGSDCVVNCFSMSNL